MTTSDTRTFDGVATKTTSASAAPGAVEPVDGERSSSRREALLATALVGLIAAVVLFGIAFPELLAPAVAIAVLASILLTMTNFGNWIKSTGGFLEAATSMGIPVNGVKLACFILCAMLAGFAGTIQVFRLQSPLPSIGESLELQAVAAAVIGGVALTGGVGTVFGATIGALLIRIIDNGLVLSRIDANWFKFAIGALTVFAVVGNSWLRRTARQIKIES